MKRKRRPYTKHGEGATLQASSFHETGIYYSHRDLEALRHADAQKRKEAEAQAERRRMERLGAELNATYIPYLRRIRGAKTKT